MKCLILPMILLCLSSAATAQEQRLVHQDAKRKFIVYTPPSYAKAPHKPLPLVIHFHGGGMTMREQMLYTQMNRTADRENFIVVYPQGVKNDWNVNFSKDSKEHKDASDDIGFTEAMVAKLKQDYRIDARRVYATGLSRGGFFSLRVAAELPHLFAAVAAVGATTPGGLADQPPGAEKVGVMQIMGTADQIVLFDGKPDGYLSANAAHQYWLRKNGIASAAVQERRIDSDRHDGTDVVVREQSGGGVSVALVTVNNGGHTWAGADPFNVGLPLGLTSRDVDANALIWEFFSKHQK